MFLKKLFFIFSWRTIALQCCASFWCTTKWISWRCTPIPSLPPHPSHRSSWVPSCAPWAIQHFALVLYFLHGRVYTSMLIPQFIPPSYPLLLLYSCSVMSDSLRPHGLQHTSSPSPSPSPRACLNSCPSSQQCHPIISASDIPFFFCL